MSRIVFHGFNAYLSTASTDNCRGVFGLTMPGFKIPVSILGAPKADIGIVKAANIMKKRISNVEKEFVK